VRDSLPVSLPDADRVYLVGLISDRSASAASVRRARALLLRESHTEQGTAALAGMAISSVHKLVQRSVLEGAHAAVNPPSLNITGRVTPTELGRLAAIIADDEADALERDNAQVLHDGHHGLTYAATNRRGISISVITNVRTRFLQKGLEGALDYGRPTSDRRGQVHPARFRLSEDMLVILGAAQSDAALHDEVRARARTLVLYHNGKTLEQAAHEAGLSRSLTFGLRRDIERHGVAYVLRGRTVPEIRARNAAVLALSAAGRPNAEIVAALGLSMPTVKLIRRLARQQGREIALAHGTTHARIPE
jgi:hypothetical protein